MKKTILTMTAILTILAIGYNANIQNENFSMKDSNKVTINHDYPNA